MPIRYRLSLTSSRPRLLPLFLPLFLPLWLAGCMVGPDYVRPSVETPAAFKEMDAGAADRWRQASAVEASEERWWRVFADRRLDELVALVDIDNQNLKSAEAQYRAARAALDASRAPLFPTLGASLGATRATTSARNADGSAVVGDTYALMGTATWEIDVWGRIRRGVETADAKLQAGAADLAAARLSARALLNQTYFQLRVADAQIAVLEKAVGAYGRFLEITRNRHQLGVASSLDIAQAESQLGTARTQLLDGRAQRSQYEHAIAMLTGKPPAALSIAPVPADGSEGPASALSIIPAVPALVPSTLLERRPDIIAAERRVATANAAIGVAQAAFFPVLNLGGSGGYRGAQWGSLAELPNRVWSLGPTLALTLFDAGARRAATDQAIATYDQAVASYRQTVLVAFQEVEDNLALGRYLEQEAVTQGQALAAARRAREVAEAQYVAGIVGALNVISAQTTELTAELGALTIRGRRLAAATVLLKNLAGAPLGAPETTIGLDERR